MGPQRLTALDVHVVANELDRLLRGKIIIDVFGGAQFIEFAFDGLSIALKIVRGNPFLILPKSNLGRRSWLAVMIGKKIDKVFQVHFDRLLGIDVSSFDRLGRKKQYHIYFELFGSGDLIATDSQNRIIAAFRKSAAKTRGAIYRLGSSAKVKMPKIDAGSESAIKQIQKFDHIDIFCHLDQSALTLEKTADLLQAAKDNPDSHIIYDENGQITGFAPYGPPYKKGISGNRCSTLLEAIARYVDFISLKNTGANPREHIFQDIKKANDKLDLLKNELEQTKMAPIYRQYGEIILANLNLLAKGPEYTQLVNPYTGKHENIRLIASLSPKENANQYFAKARKLEASIAVLSERIKKQQHHIAGLQRKLEDFSPDMAGDEISRQLPKIPSVRLPFRQFDLSDGWKVFVGKSAQSNDELTFSFARKDDIWFHAWQAAGSHVILRRPNRNASPDKVILHMTAAIAAHYSKARTSSKAPVIYTEARYVRKVKGAPGKVTVTNEKQLMVKPISPKEQNLDHSC